MLRVGKSYPCDMFDIICGTSTGGIIAALLGIRRVKVDESETMYDSLIDKVFGSVRYPNPYAAYIRRLYKNSDIVLRNQT